MMFFKRRKAKLLKLGTLREIAWDDRTVERIAQNDQLNVRITHMSKTVSLGRSQYGDRNRMEWEVHGVMTFPKFIPVEITFESDDEQFGGFFYNTWDNQEFNGLNIELPCLNIWLSDGDGRKAELLYSALRDAITSGNKYLDVRFWKNKGDGLMTQADKKEGYSYESRYPILGMVTWPGLHAERLPKWALPLGYWDFSLNTLPMQISDLERQLGKDWR